MSASPAIVNYAVTVCGSGSSVLLPMPPNRVLGNLIVVHFVNAGAIGVPAGWTIKSTNTGGNNSVAYCRVGEGGITEGSADNGIPFTDGGGATYFTATVIQVNSAAKGDPFDGYTETFTFDTNVGAMNVTPATDDTLLLHVMGHIFAPNSIVTPPSGMTPRSSASAFGHVCEADQHTHGGSGNKSATLSGATWTGAVLFALKNGPAEGHMADGAYDFAGSGFTGAAGPGEGNMAGGYDFAGSAFVGVAGAPSAFGFFNGAYDFSGDDFAGNADRLIMVDATEGGRKRWGVRK